MRKLFSVAIGDTYANYSTNTNKLFLLFVLVACSLQPLNGNSQAITFSPIPTSDPDINRPGAGAEQWNDRNDVNVPFEGTNTQRLDMYWRFNWSGLETAQGIYNWSDFDNRINEAIGNGQKFGFGVMTCYPDGGGATGVINFDNGVASYPEYVHRLMQAEGVKDWKTSGSGPTNGTGTWVPNWNSENYLNRLAAFNSALNAHIESGSYNGVKYKDVINYVDVRGYGAWGEWHNANIIETVSQFPAGTRATTATLKRIIDGHVKGFPNLPLVIMMCTFDGNRLINTGTDTEVGTYALQQRNNWGMLGWRRDNWGATDDYIKQLLDFNISLFGGYRMDTAILNRYKYAPVVGEPPGWGAEANGCAYGDLLAQVQKYHAVSFGNGNYGITPTSCMKDAVRAASKAAGYRILLTGGDIPGTINTGIPFKATLNWQNIGLTPTYDKWNVVYELRNSSDVAVWSGNSAFGLRLFQPGSATPYSDNLTVPTSVPAGSYTLKLVIKDPTGFRKPFPLAIKGRNADGSYTLKTVTVTTGNSAPASNTAPVANAGSAQTVSSPTGTVTLNGAASADADGSIASYLWQQVSGPNTSTIVAGTSPSTAVNNLIPGSYSFNLTVTDNKGATGTTTVAITVNASTANKAPVSNAGPSQTLTLPANAVTLNGSASSDTDGTIASYLWQQVSGPSTSSMSTTSGISTTVSKLLAGTYSYRLTVTDNKGATAQTTVNVYVNAAGANTAPVANAGTDRAITLPNTTISLSGSLSADANGTITGYLWQQVSGPSASTIAVTSAVTATVSKLTSTGIYIYKLTVTDNNGATASDQVTVTVFGGNNTAPTANAGGNQVLTLPASALTLFGSASDADGKISSYAWTQSSGPSSATLSNASTSTVTVNKLVTAGTYVFKLTVTDDKGATGNSDVSVIVRGASTNNGNSNPQYPIPNAGESQTITQPTSSVSLNGNLSYDPDGTITSYIWEQVSGPSASWLSSSYGSSVTANGLTSVGTYVFKLSIQDNSGLWNGATVSISVAGSGTGRSLIGTTVSTGVGQTNETPTLLNSDENLKNINDVVAGKMSVYPNPAESTLNLSLNTDKAEKITANIYSLGGQRVLSPLTENKTQGTFTKALDVSTLKPGTYMLEVIASDKKRQMLKFIKR